MFNTKKRKKYIYKKANQINAQYFFKKKNKLIF